MKEPERPAELPLSGASRILGLGGRPRQTRSGWTVAGVGIALLVILPVLSVLVIALGGGDGTWPHLAQTVLPSSIRTTLLLIAGVGVGTGFVGVGAAWLTTACTFPGRRALQLAMILPLAIPTYIAAFAYIEFMDYTGPIQSLVRGVTGFESARDYWFPVIESLPGAIFVLTFILYPYVYLTCRALFLFQSGTMLSVSRTLGAGPYKMFFRIALPLARPAIAIGVVLCLMEAMNDIGAMEYFGVRTLTFSVYDTWLNRGSLSGAAQIACVSLVFVVALIAAERLARGRQRYHGSGTAERRPTPFQLGGVRAGLAVAACLIPVVAGFLIPGWVLLRLAMPRLDQFGSQEVLSAVGNSILVSGFAAGAAVMFGLLLVYAARLTSTKTVMVLVRLASVGYAVPGTILAIGILIPLAAMDNWIDGWMRTVFGLSTGLLITGSGAAIVYACTVRFLAISVGTLEAGLNKVTEHLDMAARTLGCNTFRLMGRIHIPLLRTALTTAALLVFVDTLKELSATILLRPFNFDTLATLTYTNASRAAYGEASIPAIAIVLVGLVPVLLILRGGAASIYPEGKERTEFAEEVNRTVP